MTDYECIYPDVFCIWCGSKRGISLYSCKVYCTVCNVFVCDARKKKRDFT